jgi:hypothetical protein
MAGGALGMYFLFDDDDEDCRNATDPARDSTEDGDDGTISAA